MKDSTFTQICVSMRKDIVNRTPYDTGNLANNATRIHSLGYGKMRIYVNEGIAPYFRFVNCRPYYYVNGKNGGKVKKENRNHLYFEIATIKAIRKLVKKLDGEIRRID